MYIWVTKGSHMGYKWRRYRSQISYAFEYNVYSVSPRYLTICELITIKPHFGYEKWTLFLINQLDEVTLWCLSLLIYGGPQAGLMHVGRWLFMHPTGALFYYNTGERYQSTGNFIKNNFDLNFQPCNPLYFLSCRKTELGDIIHNWGTTNLI